MTEQERKSLEKFYKRLVDNKYFRIFDVWLNFLVKEIYL